MSCEWLPMYLAGCLNTLFNTLASSRNKLLLPEIESDFKNRLQICRYGHSDLGLVGSSCGISSIASVAGSKKQNGPYY